MPFPIILSPIAYHRVLHDEGELATARGAGAAGATWIVSTNTNTSIEDIAQAAIAPLWFQLYVQSDRDVTRDLVRRVEDAGCTALVLTVDTPTIGARNRQLRAKFELAPGIPVPHLHDVNTGSRRIMSPGRPSVTWKDVEWLKSIARVPVILKGILDAEDAELSIDAGADAIIVSNHGGRNLDTAPASADALRVIAEKNAGRLPMIVDGGIRRGTDVLKALALGATAVGIGRPYGYGLAVGGAAGVERVVRILRDELTMAMMLVGLRSTSESGASLLWSNDQYRPGLR